MFEKYSKIIVNEKEYHSLDEVPEHLRALARDQIVEALKNPGKPSAKKFDLPFDKIPEEIREKIIEEMGVTKGGNSDFRFTLQTGRGITAVSPAQTIRWILAGMAIAALIYSML